MLLIALYQNVTELNLSLAFSLCLAYVGAHLLDISTKNNGEDTTFHVLIKDS